MPHKSMDNLAKLDVAKRVVLDSIKTFVDRDVTKVSKMNFSIFLDYIEQIVLQNCDEQEQLMKKLTYPFLPTHIDLHNTLKYKLTHMHTLMETDLQKAINFFKMNIVAELDKHFCEVDTIFFDFCNTYKTLSTEEYEGKTCEIFSMNNELIGVGTIHLSENNQIIINSKENLSMKVDINNDVKIVTTGDKSLVFIAKVYISNLSTLKLLNTKLLCIKNLRKNLRVNADFKANLVANFNYQPEEIVVVNLSISGLMFVSKQIFELNHYVNINFSIVKYNITLHCRVVWVIKKTAGLFGYGCSFEANEATLDHINAYIIEQQRMMRSIIRKK